MKISCLSSVCVFAVASYGSATDFPLSNATIPNEALLIDVAQNSVSLCGIHSNDPPIYVYTSRSGEIFTLTSTNQPAEINVDTSTQSDKSLATASGLLSRKTVLPFETVAAMCSDGLNLRALPRGLSEDIEERDHQRKSSVPVVYSLPASFSITYRNYFGTWISAGSFFLPDGGVAGGTFPAGHTTQYSVYDLNTVGLTNSRFHYAHGLLVSAQSNNLDNGWSGNGYIIGDFPAYAACNGAGRNLSVIEAWRTHVQPLTSKVNFIYTGGGAGGQPTAWSFHPGTTSVSSWNYAPQTCYSHTDGVNRTYASHAGANRYVFYGIWPNGLNSSASYISPSVQTPNTPTMVQGKLGLFFGLVGAGAPLHGNQITLTFTNVSAGTF
jgi:hypothetical protein